MARASRGPLRRLSVEPDVLREAQAIKAVRDECPLQGHRSPAALVRRIDMNIRVTVCIIFLISLLFVGCEPSVKDGLTYDEYVKMVYTYQADGDYDRAIAAGKKAVRIKPNDGETHYLLANLYYEAYRKSFDAAQKKQLEDLFLHHGNRQYQDPMDEYKKFGLKSELEALADEEYKETVKYSPSNWFAWYSIATRCFNNKQFKEAIEGYKKVIAINPNYTNAYSLMGESYSRLGDYPSALKYLQEAVKMDGTDTNSLLEIGRVYQKMQEWVKAAEIKKKLIDMKASTGEL